MLISEIMNSDVNVCTEDTPLKDVYELIQSSIEGFVVVLDSFQHRVPIGIVNEHSICESVVGRQRPTRSLDAGAVLDSNIKRLCHNVEVTECESVLDRGADAILVVNERRQFLGAVDPEELERAARAAARRYHIPTIFAGVAGQQIPAAVEIPAFGWLK
ncbi:MAG TPA: CBS domain-containing protein [Pyrinomonadaceae bacterium]|jgi:predicted transcriptional regulator